MEATSLPYITITMTNSCNFKCSYCSPDGNGGFGEGYGTKNEKVDVKDLVEKIKIIEAEGIGKVRLTGGEPLVVPGTIEILRFLEKETNLEYALATNGSLTHKFIDEFKILARMDLRISLDTLKEEQFNRICGVSQYKKVIENIRELTKKGMLNRVAMVITNENIEEIEVMLNFCEQLGINLKLFDMYATPATKNRWKEEYSPLSKVKEIVEERALSVRQIGYTKNFGIPALEYELRSGIKVRIKDSTSGTRYSEDICSDCDSLPCQEGLYTILYSSDKKLIPCRLSPIQFEADTPEQFDKNLKIIVDIFKRSYHQNKFWGGDSNNK